MSTICKAVMGIAEDPLWFKNAVIYQVHVKGFYDALGSGTGNLVGLTEKLDYLESLGITTIWLLPFYPSPLKDDGYDIASYCDVHPDYGTLSDFREFLRAAHKRSIKVITELVINHTSDQHPWFQRARKSLPGSAAREFYIWSDDPNRYKEARIIFKDFEASNWTWDNVANAYYFHRFYFHQPDLNFDSPHVQKEVFRIVDFWLKMGVDGLRLDAIPYLFKRENTNCENLPETHAFIKKLRAYIDSKYPARVLLAEANQWPEDASAYFGKGDECHMAFHFPVMPRLFMAIHMEDRFSIIDILDQTPMPPETCQWVMFLRNHDELTLEMVSDEERDYMYHFYAKDPKARINLGIRRRLAPLLGNDRYKIELLFALLFSLPGTPAIYYGDEIGMGDNYYLGDRNGVRTPMQWNSSKNAGFSDANPQKLYLPLIIDPMYHYALVNVENQEQSPSSLLWWIRHILTVRKNHKAFGLGTLEFVTVDNSKILAFTLTYGDEIILVAANLSRFSQAAALDLSKHAAHTPRELFHNSHFPPIEAAAYTMTFGPYGYFWLSLHHSKASTKHDLEVETPKLNVEQKWQNVFKGRSKRVLEKAILPRFLTKARWFEHKTREIQQIKIVANIPVATSMLCIVEVLFYGAGESDRYLIPISFMSAKDAGAIKDPIASLKVDDLEGVLYDGIYDEAFRNALMLQLAHNREVKTNGFTLTSSINNRFKKEVTLCADASRVLSVEQSNSALLYGERFFFKLFRRIEEGVHPEVQMCHFLTTDAHFPHTPSFVGSIAYKKLQGPINVIGLVETFVPNEGTAWDFALDTISQFYERVLAQKREAASAKELLQELIGTRFLNATQLLAERTAQMHIALASSETAEFKPEPFTTLYQRSLYQEMRKMAKEVFLLIKKKMPFMNDSLLALSAQVLDKQEELLCFLKKIIIKPIDAVKIRIHGDYHLGQLLHTGKDFIIIDFEGEPIRSLSHRLHKRSPLRDVAGILRSFHYAAYEVLLAHSAMTPEMIARLEPWAESWYEQIREVFMKSYLTTLQTAPLSLLPSNEEDRDFLLNALILEKALYEMTYELNVRPEWVMMAFKGLLFSLKKSII